MSLKLRLALLSAVMFVAAVGVTGYVVLDRAEEALIFEVDAFVVSRAGAPGFGPGGDNPFPERINPVPPAGGGAPAQSYRPIAEVLVSADGGQGLFRAALVGETELPPPDLSSIDVATHTGIVTLPATDGESRYRVTVRPFPDGSYRVVAGSLVSVDDEMAALRRTALVAGLLAALFGALMAWLTLRRELRPLDEVVAVADRFAEGDLDARADASRSATEVGRLAAGLNDAFDRVETSVIAEKEANERLSAFVDDVAHELRTPATTIAGWTDLFDQGALEDREELERMIQRIKGETARLSSLVDEMVLIARHDTVRPNLLEAVDMVDLVADAVDDANALDQTRAAKVSVPDSAVVRGDRTRLEQVLANLLDNVRVHTPTGTAFDINVRSGAEEVVVELIDDGPGVPAALVDRVFDRSFRAATAGARGRGLGLAIVRAIIEDHGGSVALTSDGQRGTTVTVRLPAFAGA